MNGIYYGVCSTAASTKAKVAKLEDASGFPVSSSGVIQSGTVVVIKFTNVSSTATMTLQLQDKNGNNLGTAANLELYGTTAMSSGTTTNGWQAGAVVPFIYDGATWIRFFWENTTYYYTSAYCTTAAGTAVKVGTSSATQTLTGSKYFQLWIQNTNTAASALTLNMNSLGAKKIYLNGEPTSSTNYNLLRGCYLVYYDENGDSGKGCYHFRTDNKIPGNIAGNADSASSIALSGVTGADDLKAIEALTGTSGILKKTGANTWALDTNTYVTTDTKNTAGSTDTSSKIYLIGATSQANNPQTYSDNEIFATSGVLTAKTFNSTSLTASQAVSTDANKNLVSTNLTVSDPTASGNGITYIATISQGATGKITATKSTVRSASTSQTGVVKLNSAIDSTDETLAATPKAVKTVYDLANTANTTANNHKYWANVEATSAASYNAAPEMATIKLNGDTNASAASTSNVTLVYDSTLQALNFVFV